MLPGRFGSIFKVSTEMTVLCFAIKLTYIVLPAVCPLGASKFSTMKVYSNMYLGFTKTVLDNVFEVDEAKTWAPICEFLNNVSYILILAALGFLHYILLSIAGLAKIYSDLRQVR